jgi:hypothetical protein
MKFASISVVSKFCFINLNFYLVFAQYQLNLEGNKRPNRILAQPGKYLVFSQICQTFQQILGNDSNKKA